MRSIAWMRGRQRRGAERLLCLQLIENQQQGIAWTFFFLNLHSRQRVLPVPQNLSLRRLPCLRVTGYSTQSSSFRNFHIFLKGWWRPPNILLSQGSSVRLQTELLTEPQTTKELVSVTVSNFQRDDPTYPGGQTLVPDSWMNPKNSGI